MKKLALLSFAVIALATSSLAAELKILLPLGRTAYQTNEWIDVAVVRSAQEALTVGNLTLTLSGDDASKAVVVMPVKAAAVEAGTASRTENLHLNGFILRPGRYTLEIACDGATQKAVFEVYSHIRKSTFRNIDWGCSAKGPEQSNLGEDGMGLNLIYASYGGFDQDANIRGGLDFMRNDTMGGAHQMDGRLECDWSDPYVLAGGMARVARQALTDRTTPHAIGVHFYDEPGLTWQKHPKTGLFTGHGIIAQDRAYESAYGNPPMQYYDVKPADPQSVDQWDAWCRWKLSFMDAAWKAGAFSVSYVNPSFISATQSVYGWHAFGDGYYFNVVRSLPVISGHGGYDDYAGGYFNPGYFAEFGRMRDWNKPLWYLPTWWEVYSPDLYRCEQYLTFMLNVQGLCKPPGQVAHKPGSLHDPALVEVNKLALRLGTIFTTMPVTRCDVAVLYSMSQNVKAMADSKDLMNFQDFQGQVERLEVLTMASKMARIPLWPVVEEDILDGTLAANHKAIILTGIERLDPAVVQTLEQFAAKGGKVILGDECTVKIAGATKLGCSVTTRIYVECQKAFADAKAAGANPEDACLKARRIQRYFEESQPVATAVTKVCKDLGVMPVADCDNPKVFVTRQAQGDVEYFFVVNATNDDEGVTGRLTMNKVKSAEATLGFVDDGRPLYDAIWGGPASDFKAAKGKLTAKLRFGGGQMRAYARTTRPIGGVLILPTVVAPADYTLPRDPIRVELTAFVTDAKSTALSGAFPLAIQVTDPLGVTRYDLFRATDRGVLRLSLPLAVNDPAGQWKVTVRELVGNKEATATFQWRPPVQCGAIVGATRRAVIFGQDIGNVYRFFRVNRDVTLVTGKSEYNAAAAQRLTTSLERWGVRCTTVPAAEVKPRELSAEAAKTWTGANAGLRAGFDLRGGVILLGTPEDNPLIAQVASLKVLPYVPGKDVLPGRGNGYIAWQTDCIGFYNQESLTLIAYDADGMAQAAGQLYELAAGLDPLTPWNMPTTAEISPATQAPGLLPAAATAWEVIVPDTVIALKAEGNGAVATCMDGSVCTVAADGKVATEKVLKIADIRAAFTAAVKSSVTPEDAKAFAVPARVAKFVARGEGVTAVGYWGGLLKTFDAQGKGKTSQMMPQDIGGLAWVGGKLVVGLANGKVVALDVK